MKNIVVIGGGTGTFNVLTGLKKYPCNLSAIVTMADSGGSNRVIRNEFGLLPTSDIRQCIVALASESENELLRKLFVYRYSQGIGISGMTFGNLFMAALAEILGSQEAAIKETCRFFNVTGKVIPVTYQNSNLVAEYEDGAVVLGEHEIDEPDNRNQSRIIKISIFPKVRANQDAIDAIIKADWLIIGPGDLYTSILCNLAVDGITQAIDYSNARILYIVNLMTRAGQTLGYSANDHIAEINRYLKKKQVSHVLLHKGNFPKDAIAWYAQIGTAPVKDDLPKNSNLIINRKDVVSNQSFNKNKADKLIRSLIRHDPDKLAKILFKIING